MTKGTAQLRSSIWAEFQAWLSRAAGDDVWATLERQPDLLVEVLLSYGQTLFDGGRPLQEYRQLLAHSQQVVPRVKLFHKPAWNLLSKWERVEPTVHRTPMPEPIVWAMIALAISWGCLRVGLFGCRPGVEATTCLWFSLAARDRLAYWP